MCLMDYGLDGIGGLGWMEVFTDSMTLESDLTGSQWKMCILV